MTSSSGPSATELARAVVDLLTAAGVREVVLAPGSRNAPLAFAAYDAAAAGRLRLHTRIDERTAGFLALGLTKVGSPAAVVCTSGTAVANLHPAVLEAAHAGVPLVVVTADRPASLRGTGANQTTDQVDLFGPMADCVDVAHVADLADIAHVADLADIAHAADLADIGRAADLADIAHAADVAAHGRGRGAAPTGPLASRPLHLNVQLVPPLVELPQIPAELPRNPVELPHIPVELPRSAVGPPRGPGAESRAPRSAGSTGTLALGPRTVVVAGDDAGPPARLLAERAGWPLLAEPTSGCRTGSNAIRTYRLLLGTGLGEQVERAVVAGHPTLSRPVTDLLSRPGVEVVSVRTGGHWTRRPFPVTVEYDAVMAPPGEDVAWLASWREADAALGRRVDALVAAEPELTPYEVAAAVSRAVEPGALLVVGASHSIRDLDLMARPWPAGGRQKVVANRGLSGIDGTVSTAVGAALGRPHSSRALALVGDVTFLHDANGLVLGPDEPTPDLTLVVVNDDGGSIFAVLEQGDPAYADRYDRLFGTPHGVDLARLCAATRTPHWRVGSLAELEHALASPAGGVEVVEVVVRRDNRRDLDARLRALAGE